MKHMNQSYSASDIKNPEATKSTFLVMAVTCGFAVANIYYNQPMLGDLSRSFNIGDEFVGLVPTATQVGYAVGLLFLVSLGDRFERRNIILVQSVALIVALTAAALSPSLSILVITSLFIGLFGTIATQLVPMAAQLTTPERRGMAVGTIMSGLFIGIVCARALSGVVTQYWGWRAMFWMATVIMIVITGTVWSIFPRVYPVSKQSYWEILLSLQPLLKEEPELRAAAITGSLLFAAFSIFWSTLTLHLESPIFNLGSAATGFFGFIGIAGAFAAPIAGRFSDKASPQRVVGFGVVCVILSFIILTATGNYLIGLITGVIILDLGVQAAHIANQSRIYSLRPGALSRVNAVYMFIYFIGGATGSILGSVSWAYGGWVAVGVTGTIVAMFALISHVKYLFPTSNKLFKR
jgi:predicted MFS family arabinose efflux permease